VLERGVQHAVVLDGRSRADRDVALVAAQHRAGPDRAVGPDRDLTDDDGVGMDEGIGVDVG
jgi:hypothetical protein